MAQLSGNCIRWFLNENWLFNRLDAVSRYLGSAKALKQDNYALNLSVTTWELTGTS